MTAKDYSVIQADDLHSLIVRQGLAYWFEKKGGRLLPARSDFDPPVERPRLCSSIILLDVLRDPLDFRYRLIGDKVRQRHGGNWVGRRFSEIAHQCYPNPIWLNHQWVVENRQPRFFRPGYIRPDQDFLFIEAAILPLGEDPEQVDMLMEFVEFVPKEGN